MDLCIDVDARPFPAEPDRGSAVSLPVSDAADNAQRPDRSAVWTRIYRDGTDAQTGESRWRAPPRSAVVGYSPSTT